MALTQEDLETIRQMLDNRVPQIITDTVQPLLTEAISALAETSGAGIADVQKKQDAMHVHLTNQIRDLESRVEAKPAA